MAELETIETAERRRCCSPAAQETCCEPEARANAAAHGDGCGCSAGAAAGRRRAPRGRPRALRGGGDAAEAGSPLLRRAAVITDEQRGRSAPASTTRRPRALPDAARSRRSAAAIRPPSPTCTRARPSSTSAPGGGIDVLLSARRVGPTGKAYGLDMTDEMLELARAEPGRGRSRERRVRQGDDRGDPAARRLGRRDHLQLRHQPLRRQAAGPPRGGAGPATRRPVRGQRRRRRSRHGRGDAARHAAVDRLHRRSADPGRVRARAGRGRASRRSRSARPTASTTRRASAIVRARLARQRLTDASRSSSTIRRRSTGAGRTRSGARSRSTSPATASSGRRWTAATASSSSWRSPR